MGKGQEDDDDDNDNNQDKNPTDLLNIQHPCKLKYLVMLF